jgi:hypothetical protein
MSLFLVCSSISPWLIKLSLSLSNQTSICLTFPRESLVLGNNKAENFLALSLRVQTVVDVFLQLLLTYSSPHLHYFTTFIYDPLHISPPHTHGATAPSGPGPPHYRGLTITLRHTTPGRTPLDEWSARSKCLYRTTRNTHKRQTSMSTAGLKPAIPASERPQTHVATGIGLITPYLSIFAYISYLKASWLTFATNFLTAQCLLHVQPTYFRKFSILVTCDKEHELWNFSSYNTPHILLAKPESNIAV